MIETYEKKMNNVPVHGSREIPVIRKDGTLINLYIDMAFVSTFKGPSIICYYMDTAEINSKEIVLRQRLKRLRLIIQSSRDIFFDWDIATGHLEHGSAFLDMLGYEPGEYQPSYEMWASLLHPEEKGWITKALHDHLDGKTDFYESEHRFWHKAGHYVWIEARGMVTIRDEKGRPLRMSGSYLDITRRKTLEIEIATTRSELERLVQERTTELNETNIALKVLLNKKEAEKTGFENSIVMNIRGRLHPHINKLRNSGLERDQLAVLEMLEKDVQEIMSPFLNKIKMDYPTLTPREIQIVERIRNGKKSNDIANEFHISVRTVDLFRHKIRKKLNINGRKVKLESIISCI
jgi:PAS domain S-box-containing protein